MANKFTFTEKKDTRSGFGAGLLELGRKNPNVVALCADLTGSLKMDAFEKETISLQLSNGIYLWEVINNTGIVAKGKLVIIKN
jgi:transketolase C-terminal domain/subunit